MTPPKNLWSEIKYWIVILLFLGFIFEMVASMVLYRKYTTGKLAILHFTQPFFRSKPSDSFYTLYRQARADSSLAVSKAIAEDSYSARNFSYEPWLMFRAADYSSKYVNIKGFERKSAPAECHVPGSPDTVDIYFFGGNSLYGQSLADAETIPSQLVKQYMASPTGKSIRVKNFGVPLYYSRQELMLLSSLIFQGHRPDVVVFVDGATDFSDPHMLYYDKPYYSYALEQTFEGKMFQKSDAHFVDSTNQFDKDPPGIDAESFYNALLKKYANNLKQAAMICNKAGIRTYFFCETVSQNRPSARIAFIYPMLAQNGDSIPNFTILKSKEERSYSPASAGTMAAQILATIKNDLQ